MTQHLNKLIILLIGIGIFTVFNLNSAEKTPDIPKSFYALSAENINGEIISMETYKGKKVLVVNVASRCGYTPQYEGLQTLYETYHDSLVVLGFPSNDFLWQEPGNNTEIKTFCQRTYGVTFPMFGKIHVKGRKQHPLYTWLSDSTMNGWNHNNPSWNFNKYLLDENGKLLEWFGADIEPLDTLITRHLLLETINLIPDKN
ncbi:MAG TPA: glutathione peroxidase [Candidatus Marinimicrobia bacterium]|jgi:glutathione peroxidase|nr:glutathione peroxidase [Candidatus Neomarinimicrobiota bacterium]|tara:strand:+ start:58 stop:660 length:603 start_codon:yes stop_codon:yes gene_type:complete